MDVKAAVEEKPISEGDEISEDLSDSIMTESDISEADSVERGTQEYQFAKNIQIYESKIHKMPIS